MISSNLKNFIERNSAFLEADLRGFLGKAMYFLPGSDFETLVSMFEQAGIDFHDVRTELLINKFNFIFPTVSDGTPLIDVIYDVPLVGKDRKTYFGLTNLDLFRFVQEHAEHWKDDMYLEVNRYSNVVVRTNYDS